LRRDLVDRKGGGGIGGKIEVRVPMDEIEKLCVLLVFDESNRSQEMVETGSLEGLRNESFSRKGETLNVLHRSTKWMSLMKSLKAFCLARIQKNCEES